MGQGLGRWDGLPVKKRKWMEKIRFILSLASLIQNIGVHICFGSVVVKGIGT